MICPVGIAARLPPARKRFDVPFLHEAFEKSRERLKRDTIDVVLLHNPTLLAMGSGEPTVSRADNDNDEPVIYLSMYSDARSLREVSDLAELLVVKRLQGATGVGNVEVNGSVQRELRFIRSEARG